MKTPTKLAEDYIALWNERDPKRRMELLAAAWTTGARYADPLMRGTGAAEISTLVGAIHERFPAFRFALSGKPDGFEDAVRFSWTLGPQGGDALIEGTDFVQRDGDRIASVTGLLDRVPCCVLSNKAAGGMVPPAAR